MESGQTPDRHLLLRSLSLFIAVFCLLAAGFLIYESQLNVFTLPFPRLCISYLDDEDVKKPVQRRRAQLFETFRFTCSCVRCVADEKLPPAEEAKPADAKAAAKAEAKSEAKAEAKAEAKPAAAEGKPAAPAPKAEAKIAAP